MRALKRNKVKLWYQLYDSNIPVYEKDLDGNPVLDPVTGKPLLTGEYIAGYKSPVLFYANISPARSEASTDPFGVNVEYDKTICSCRLMSFPCYSWTRSHNMMMKDTFSTIRIIR